MVNIGDLLVRWSNDRFRSTLHRVVNRSGRQRLSIPVFYDPDSSAMVDPRDLSPPPGEAARYDPITAGDDIMLRNKLSFAHYAET